MSSKFSDLLTECKLPGSRRGGLAFFLLLSLYLTALWWYEGVQTSTVAGRSWIVQFLRYFGDAALVTIPFALVKPRLRWIVFIPLWIITIWVSGAMWYFRFWGEIPGVSTVFLVGNVGYELFHSLVALWHLSDFIFIALLVALTIGYKSFPPAHTFRLRLRGKLLTCGFTLLCFTTGQAVNSIVYYKVLKSLGLQTNLMKATTHRLTGPIFTNVDDMGPNGPIVHFLKSTNYAIKVITLKKNLTVSDRKTIEDFIGSTPEFPAIADSIIEANQAKNVILILVESLNADAIRREVDGKPIAPTLCSLIDAEGTISALNVTTQVRAGGSGDGQLLTNTGLHPLPYFSVPIALGSSNSFPALPKILGKEQNVVVFADDCRAWNEQPTFSSYGFSPVYSNLDYPDLVPQLGGDGAMLGFASKIIPTLSKPFFMELLTVSMHAPFNDTDIPSERLPKLSSKGFEQDPTALDYLRMLKYFDTELGIFLKTLKDSGVYDNTLIIIASDHSQELTDSGHNSTPMALIIANCGITEKIDRTVGQVDIFPTILNLTGSVGPQNYRGVGTSIISPTLNAALTSTGAVEGSENADVKRLTDAQYVSELIHRTNYFAH